MSEFRQEKSAQGRGSIKRQSPEAGQSTASRSLLGLTWGLGTWACSGWILLMPLPATAQIISDGSWGSLVNGSATESCQTAVCSITGGTLNQAESTLFHSLSQFSLPGGVNQRSALFVDPGVGDIVVRVTGGTRSLIDNAIRTSAGSAANLYLINPSGISFGTGARLDLGGAFTASTARKVYFDNASVLATDEATAPTDSLLTVSAPVGLGFVGEASAPITVQGTGHAFKFGSQRYPRVQFVNHTMPSSQLSVRSGEAIALIGNGLSLQGGNLSALGGQIELGSVSAGTVTLKSPQFSASSANSSAFDYDQVATFADISLTGRSSLDVSDSHPGRIELRGADISVTESSTILAETLAGTPAEQTQPSSMLATPGAIDILASTQVHISGLAAPPSASGRVLPFLTYLSVDVAPEATGQGGNIQVRSPALSLRNGAQLSASTFGMGDAGKIQADITGTLLIDGIGRLGPSGLFSNSHAMGRGDTGAVLIHADYLDVRGGARITANNFNGRGSGYINIKADRMALTGTSARGPTAISALNRAPGKQGEDIVVNAREVSVLDGAKLVTGTTGAGNAAGITLFAEDVIVSGYATNTINRAPSAISTAVFAGATGRGGDLSVTSQRLSVLNGGQIATSTLGFGRAGDLFVRSHDVMVSGRTADGRSGLFATAISRKDALSGAGAGGNILVEAGRVEVTEGGTLSVGNFPSGQNQTLPGQGPAGDLTVTASEILLADESLLSADTAAGDRGNITLNTDRLVLRRGSRITTNATQQATGGNIAIRADNGFVIAIPEENSDITANAVSGDAGSVKITAQGVFGIEPRAQLTPLSDITATSSASGTGEIRLQTPDTSLENISQPVPVPTDMPVVATGCAPGGSHESRFVSSGRGGLRASPYGVLDSRESLTDISLPSALQSKSTLATEPATTTSASMEAQGWSRDAQGQVRLLAAAEPENSSRCLSWRQ